MKGNFLVLDESLKASNKELTDQNFKFSTKTGI